MTIGWLLENGAAQELGDHIVVRVKAVPGAKRSEITGILGDRLKVRVAAPAEGGKANRAICQILVEALNLKRAQVSVQSGHASPEKVLRIEL